MGVNFATKTKMYTSTAYGLILQSELPLLEAIDHSSEPDVVVRFESLDPAMSEFGQGNSIHFKLQLGLELLVRDGCEIVVDASPNLDRGMIRAHVLGVGMAVILRQRGFLVLHASCVAKHDGAIAFLGGSGWGKSTLASAFLQQGYRLITDDVMAIQQKTPTPQVIPSFPEVKLLPDAVAAVGAAKDLPMLHSLSYKQIQRLDAQFAHHPVPLKYLFGLRLGTCNEIEPLSGHQAFAELVQHSRVVKTLTNPALQIQHFQQCVQLLKGVPMSYLKRPRSLEQLPQLVEFIETHL
jgi:hypothetical protein